MAHRPESTYTNDPGASDIDAVRLLVGDTDCTTPGAALLTDAEIQNRIDAEASNERAAWRSCQDIISKLTRVSADFGAGSQRQSKSQTLKHYRDLLIDLKRRGGGEFVALLAGGLSESEKQANEENDDRVQGQFRSNQFRNPRTGVPDPPSSIRETFE